jgi:hypothetical protein
LRLVWSALRHFFISDVNQYPLGYLAGYLFAMALLAINGDPGPIALYHQHNRWPLRNPLFSALLYLTSQFDISA